MALQDPSFQADSSWYSLTWSKAFFIWCYLVISIA